MGRQNDLKRAQATICGNDENYVNVAYTKHISIYKLYKLYRCIHIYIYMNSYMYEKIHV